MAIDLGPLQAAYAAVTEATTVYETARSVSAADAEAASLAAAKAADSKGVADNKFSDLKDKVATAKSELDKLLAGN